MLEAGIDIDLVTLKLVGSRGCLIAVIGSFAPIVIAFAVALAIGSEVKEAIAAGASFGPTSLGIALNILRAGNVLNTPTGQMIIAAAIIDDMIAVSFARFSRSSLVYAYISLLFISSSLYFHSLVLFRVMLQSKA